MRAETVAQTTVKETVATTRVGDIRVSTADQRLDAQRERLTTRIRTRGLNGARGAHPLHGILSARATCVTLLGRSTLRVQPRACSSPLPVSRASPGTMWRGVQNAPS